MEIRCPCFCPVESDLVAAGLADTDAEPLAGEGLVCAPRLTGRPPPGDGVVAVADMRRLPLARPRLIVCLLPLRSAVGEKSEDACAPGVVGLDDRALARDEAVGLDGVPVSCGRSG